MKIVKALGVIIKYISLYIFFSLLISILIYKLYNINNFHDLSIFITTPVFAKYFYLTYSVIFFILMLDYILNITTIYLIKTNKLTKSIFKPSFLNNFIGKFEEAIKHRDIGESIQFYYRMLFFVSPLFITAVLLYYCTTV